MSKREDHYQEKEEKAKRSLEDLKRRWSNNPNVYYFLLIAVLLVILLLSWL